LRKSGIAVPDLPAEIRAAASSAQLPETYERAREALGRSLVHVGTDSPILRTAVAGRISARNLIEALSQLKLNIRGYNRELLAETLKEVGPGRLAWVLDEGWARPSGHGTL
jgi:hypothetical protein